MNYGNVAETFKTVVLFFFLNVSEHLIVIDDQSGRDKFRGKSCVNGNGVAGCSNVSFQRTQLLGFLAEHSQLPKAQW